MSMGSMPNLTQGEADGLLAVKKVFEDRTAIIMNRPYREERKIISAVNNSDIFYLNITETAIEFGKYSLNNRYFQTPLVRVCIDSSAVHENPDGTLIKGSHIHLYKESYGDKFATDLRVANIDGTTPVQVLGQFLKFCNIEDIEIQNQERL